MRLFQIKLTKIDDYSWTLGKSGDKYHDEYAVQRAEAAALIEGRAKELLAFGIIDMKDDPLVVNASQLVDLSVNNIKYEMIREIKIDDEDPTDLNGVMRKFNRMAAKLMSLPGLQRNDTHHDAQNERVHVHMPGQALGTYNEVQLLENLCSDELQRSLDNGWRIIAACPQPDARRPDYILGKYNPARDSDSTHYAARQP